MHAKQLFANVAFNRIRPDGASFNLAAGQSTTHSDAVNSKNGNAIAFLLLIGAVVATAVTTITPEFSTDNGGTWTAYPNEPAGAGTLDTVLDDSVAHKMVAIEIYRPQAGLTRLKIVRATANVTIEGLLSSVHDLRYTSPMLASGNFDKSTAITTPDVLDGNTNMLAAVVNYLSPALTQDGSTTGQ